MTSYEFDGATFEVQGAHAVIRWAATDSAPQPVSAEFALSDVTNAYVAEMPDSGRSVLVILYEPHGDESSQAHQMIGITPRTYGTATSVTAWLQQVIAHYRGEAPELHQSGGAQASGGRWVDRAVASTRVALSSARTSGRQLVSELDSQYGSRPEYRSLRSSLTSAKGQTREAIADLRQARHETIEQLSATATGAAVGERTRQFSTVVSKLPVLSAITDAALSRHGVAVLHERFTQDPADPLGALLLAEALLRVRKDLLRYRIVRSITSPTYLVISQSVRTAGAIGKQDADPPETVLLKRAFAGAKRRVRSNPGDAEALHVVARVYLARQYLAHAERFARVAYRVDPANPLPLITVALAQLASGRPDEARHTAERAVARGAGFGNEVLARLVLADAANDADVARYESLRAAVSPQDQIAYLGVSVSGAAWWDDFKTRQHDKAKQLMTWTEGSLV